MLLQSAKLCLNYSQQWLMRQKRILRMDKIKIPYVTFVTLLPNYLESFHKCFIKTAFQMNL